jgi:hypothetical protein
MARRSTPTNLAERVAALEAAWDSFPEKVAAAMEKVAEKLTPRDHHDGLSQRVIAIEAQVQALALKNAYAAGAVKVETRVEDQAHRWAQTIVPLVWPVCLAFAAYQLSGALNAG